MFMNPEASVHTESRWVPRVREYKGCWWNNDSLTRIGKLLDERPELGKITYSTRGREFDFSRPSLDELRSALSSNTMPGDPDRVDNLTITATGPGHAVRFEIDQDGSRWQVESGEPYWRSSLAHGLEKWAEYAGGRVAKKRRLRYPTVVGLAQVGLAAVCLATGILPKTPWAVILTITIALIGPVAAYLSANVWRRPRPTRLSPFGELPTTGWWAAMNRSDRILTVTAGISGLTWLTALAALFVSLS